MTPTWVLKLAASGHKAIADTVASPVSIELITAEHLDQCTTHLSKERCIVMASLLNKLCPMYGIKTKDVLHEFLANVLQESLEFQHKVENMYYRAQTLADTWPGRYSSTTKKPYSPNGKASKLAGKPKELAIDVYGGRMGNRPGTEDGWNLRGGGFIGLTGFYVYDAFRKYKGHKTVEETAEYVRGSDYGALDSALWFFCVLKDLMDEADRDEMIGIVKEINGGTIGLKDRMYYYKLVTKHVV